VPRCAKLVNDITRRQINEFDGFSLTDGRTSARGGAGRALKLLLTVAPEAGARPMGRTTEIVVRDTAIGGRTHGELRHPDNLARA